MNTRVLLKKYFGKNKSKKIEILQTHWFYILPSLMVNFIEHGTKSLSFNWLFMEFEYSWNNLYPTWEIGNTCSNV